MTNGIKTIKAGRLCRLGTACTLCKRVCFATAYSIIFPGAVYAVAAAQLMNIDCVQRSHSDQQWFDTAEKDSAFLFDNNVSSRFHDVIGPLDALPFRIFNRAGRTSKFKF